MKTTITTLWLHYEKDKSRWGETGEEAIAEAQGRISSDFDYNGGGGGGGGDGQVQSEIWTESKVVESVSTDNSSVKFAVKEETGQ